MNTPNTTQGQTQEKHPINLATKFQGYLAHDNKYFDRTCPQCKGYHCSYETATCPKCGSQLTFITTGKGQIMGISEGTFYPCLPSSQKERDLAIIKSDPNGMQPKYRFKLFSFGDENGALAPHPAHAFCHSGALIELISINHQQKYKWFMGTDKETGQKVAMVEVTYLIYDNYGDSITLLKGPKKNAALTTTIVNPDGSNASLPPVYGPNAQPNNQQTTATAGGNADLAQTLKQMQEQILQITSQLMGNPAPQPQPQVQPQPQPQPQVTGDNSVDPFAGAL